jgi:hypothetical protein
VPAARALISRIYGTVLVLIAAHRTGTLTYHLSAAITSNGTKMLWEPSAVMAETPM